MSNATHRRDWRWPLSLFLFIIVIHSMSGIKMTGDSLWTLHTTMSILAEGDVDLTEYGLEYGVHEHYTVHWVDGVPYNMFPLGPSLWSLPFVALIDGGMRLFMGRSYQTELLAGHHSDAQEACASVAVGVAAIILWYLGRGFGLGRWRTLLLVVLFAFGTSVWSAGSRALWPHGPSLVWLGVALLCLVRAEQRPRLLWLAGAALALAYVTRPTNAISVMALTIYAMWRFRRQAVGLVVAGGIGALLFAWHNLAVYGEVLPPYFQLARLAGSGTQLEALAGNLISPGRGLFTFTPVLLFSFYGWWLWQKDDRWRPLINVLVVIIFAHWLAISRFPHWWAGWSYGPRFFTDMMLYFAVLLVPVMGALEFRTLAGRIRGGVFVAALVMGIAFHGAGATLVGPMHWTGVPADIDKHPERVWDWGDPQFLRWVEREVDDPPL